MLTTRRLVWVFGCALLVLMLGAAPAFAAVPVRDIPLDLSSAIRNVPAPRQLAPDEAEAALAALGDPVPVHNGREPDLYLTMYDWDPAHAGPHIVPFWKEYIGGHSDVYVGWNDLTPPPTSSQQAHTILPSQIESIGVEFDTRIWASDVFHFGWYEPRVPVSLPPEQQATYDGTRAAIFVYNIRDEAYWSSYRFYTAGFFWGGLNDELGVNAIFIDSYDWANRTGPDSARPRLYEGTVAHEFQHLIHSDVDTNEDSFIDEGMADLAEQFIYGTQTTASHIGEYLYYHRDSLTDWKGELFDYGGAALWQDYLWEQAGGDALATPSGDPLAGRVAPGSGPFDDTADKFVDDGDAFIWDLIHNQNNGMPGVADLVGGMDEVKALHRDWTLANLLDGKVEEPEWNYRNLALGGADSEFLSVDDGIAFYDSRVNGNMPPTRKNVRRRTVVEAWGAYYRTFGGPEPGILAGFSGDVGSGVAPYSGSREWYSGLGNQLGIADANFRRLERDFTVTDAAADLSFRTWFDIEDGWDYGYILASWDGGATWEQLPQLSALPAATSNLYGSSAYIGPGGLTGNSGGWQLASFDLGGRTGTVRIRFDYRTDEAVNGQGWYIDDVSVGAEVDPIDATGTWVSEGWLFTSGLQANAWTADIYAPYAKATRRGYSLTPIELSVNPGGTLLTGSTWVPTQYLKSGKAYGIVGNRPDGVFDANGRLTVLKSRTAPMAPTLRAK